MLVNDLKIRVVAGAGGKGAVAFNKNMMSLGPSGGSGGRGGNVYFEGVSNLNALHKLSYKKEFKAENGKDGRAQFCDGRDGEDLFLKIPVGTMVSNLKTNEKFEIKKIGEKIMVAQGGIGGRGNFRFRSSKNTSPKKFEHGKPGRYSEFHLNLKLIADVGFIGLPNVGKSSLLNNLTNTKSKVANYPFTTLEPNLGAYYDLILADIPGLIKGASSGKGLGVKFLKYIEYTKVIFHLISSDSTDPVSDYKIVRNELLKYNKSFLTKPEYIFITKKDLVDFNSIQKISEKFKKINKEIALISMFDSESIDVIKKILNGLIDEKTENSL